MTQNNPVFLTVEKIITDQTFPSWVYSLLESKNFVAENVDESLANHAHIKIAVPFDSSFQKGLYV